MIHNGKDFFEGKKKQTKHVGIRKLQLTTPLGGVHQAVWNSSFKISSVEEYREMNIEHGVSFEFHELKSSSSVRHDCSDAGTTFMCCLKTNTKQIFVQRVSQECKHHTR